MQKKFPTILPLLLILTWFVPLARGFDNASKAPHQVMLEYSREMAGYFLGGHDTITAEGMLLKKQVHSGDGRFQQWADREAGLPLRIGAHDEDTNQPLNFILQDPPLGPNGWGDFYRHFYDSRLGDDGENAIGPQATKAVKDYLQKIRDLTHCTSKGFESLSAGDKSRVYDYLGRIAHLYQDMFCPSHVRVESHPFHNPYERYINDRWGEIVRSTSFQDRVTIGAYLSGDYDIGTSINPILAMKVAAQKSIGFWSEDDLCEVWGENRASCALVNNEKLQHNIDVLVPEAILSTAGYIDSIYRASKAEPDSGNICLPKPLQGPGGDHPDDRFDVSDAFYWQDRFEMSEARLAELLMRTALKKGKQGVWYRKRLTELHGLGKSAPAEMPISEKTKIYQEYSKIRQKLEESIGNMDWEASPDVALFAYGFYNPAISLMLKIKEPVRFLDLDLDPSIVKDHPVMLVPTAGLAGFEQSTILKAKLEEYVRLGGTLIVFAQQLGHHFNILPAPSDPGTGEVKPVSGYGYQQDQNCQQGSVFIETNHAVLSGCTTSSVDVGVDGYLSSYPDNSIILLRRTANGQPAMILYPYGNGHVLVTTLYSDFAFAYNQANRSEIDLVANIISWAKKPTGLPQIYPGETISLNFPVVNVMDSDAAVTKLRIYSPSRSVLLAEQSISGLVPASGSTVITTQVAVPESGMPGVYQTDYVLLDTQGNVVQPPTETDLGRFVVARPPRTGFPDKLIWFSVTTSSQNVPVGATFDYTFHIYNNSDQTRNLTIKSIFGHTNRPHTWSVTVYPRTVATITGSDTFEDRQYLYDTMRAFLMDEVNQEIGRYELSFKGFFPAASISVAPDRSTYSNNDTVVLGVSATSAYQGTFTLKTAVLNPYNALVFEDDRIVAMTPGATTMFGLQYHLPADSHPGKYIVRSEIWHESRLLSSSVSSFELPRSQIVITVNEGPSFRAGHNTISLALRNNGRVEIRRGNLDIEFVDPQGRSIYRGSHPFSLAPGEALTISVPVVIPSLFFGDYILNYAQSDETKAGKLVATRIPNSVAIVLSLDKPSYRIRENANVRATITNTGKFDLDSVYGSLDVAGMAFGTTQTLSVPRGQSFILDFSIPIPETTPAGTHLAEFILAAPSGGSVWQATTMSVPEASLVVRYGGPTALNPRDSVSLFIENTGGIDATYSTERLSLTDTRGTAIHSGSTSGMIRAGETKSFYQFEMPSQVARGDGVLNIDIKDNNTHQSYTFLQSFQLSGLEARMGTRTDKDVYVGGETVMNTTETTNDGPPIENATLNLSVYRLKAGIEGQFSHLLPKAWLPIVQPTGVAAGPDRFLYVADPEAKRLIKIDADGHFVQEFHYNKSCGGGAGDLCRPHAVTVSPDGFVYVVDTGSAWYYGIQNCIQKFDRYGNPVATWAYCNTNVPFALNNPLAITAGADGHVYVVDNGNHRIVKFDSEGRFVAAWGEKGEGPGQFIYPTSIAADDDGNVYVTDTEDSYYPYSRSHRVQKFDRHGRFITQWGGYGTDDGFFMVPSGIVVDKEGHVYVSDTASRMNASHRIQKFQSDGTFVTSWGGWGRVEGTFDHPKGLAAGLEGAIYVADSLNSRIQKFDSNGNFIDLWGGEGSTNGFLGGPQGIGVDNQGFVYVADYYNERIQKFDRNGNFVALWGSEGTGIGQFRNGPESIAVSKEGFVYAANGSAGDARIQKFDLQGNYITNWGSKGTGDGQFSGTQRLAVSPGGFVYVSDTGTKRIQKFDGNGNFVRAWGGPGDGGGRFTEPIHIASSQDGFVYVAEPHRIQKFDENGVFLAEWGTQGPAPGQFNSIKAIATDGTGFVYAVDAFPVRVQKFDSNGNFVTQWVEGEGDGMDLFRLPSGMVIEDDGSILISDGNGHRVRRLTQLGTEEIFRTSQIVSQSGNTTQQHISQLGSATVSGKLYVEATLRNVIGQILSKTLYPFYVASANILLTMSSDKKIYRPGETVQILGEVVNLSDTPLSGCTVTILQQSVQGTKEVFRSDLIVGGKSSVPFSLALEAKREGAFALTATVNSNDLEVASVTEHFEVREPKLSAEVVAPYVAGDQPFSVDLIMKNTGNIDVMANIDSSIDQQTYYVKLTPGSQKVIRYPQQISQDTTYTFFITGDVTTTLTKTITYGMNVSISSSAAPSYKEGQVVIPVSIENMGFLDAEINLEINLQPLNFLAQKTYYIPQFGGADDVLIFDLAEGDYTLTLTTHRPPASAHLSFSVKKERNVEMTPLVTGWVSDGLVSVSSTVTNKGYRDVEGTIQLSLFDAQGRVVWETHQALRLEAGEPWVSVPVSVSFAPALLQPGNYTIKMIVFNEGNEELTSQTIAFSVAGANIRLTRVPSFQTVSAGAEAIFPFTISNEGFSDGRAELIFRSGDFIDFVRHEWVSPGAEKEVVYAFPLPTDLETKDYLAEYELKSEGVSITKGYVKYHVAGIDIGVSASLDKVHYREGDIARLGLTITDRAGHAGQKNLFARVKYGDYEAKQAFTLTGSHNLSFAIPLLAISGEKLFYGIYEEGGRSIHLNSLYVNKGGDVLTITTDKQVYSPGEAVLIHIEASTTGTLTLSTSGWYEETLTLNGSASRSFVIPRVVLAGTYFVDARLATSDGNSYSLSKPFDVAGISVKVKEAILDKGTYRPGDTARLSLRIESNTDMPATLKVWTVGPDRAELYLGENQVRLNQIDHVIVSGIYPLTITSSGVHKVLYGIYAGKLLLASGNLSFDAGAGVVLGITSDRQNYQTGSEVVAVSVNLFGKGESTLAISLNGTPVRTEVLNLNGFFTATFHVSPPEPGVYTVTASLTSEGLSSVKETTVLYGTNAPDLVANIWGSSAAISKDGTLKLIASVRNRGKTSANPASVTVHDGSVHLSTFLTSELAAGDGQSFEYLWNVFGKAGEHTIMAIVEPANPLNEFSRENNRSVHRIVVPDVALVTETEKETYSGGEVVGINATVLNLTAATNYGNLVCTTVVEGPAGLEVFRRTEQVSLPASHSALIQVTWDTAGLPDEGKYIIRQSISSGSVVVAQKTRNLTITAPVGFALRVDPDSLRIRQGEAGSVTIAVTARAGWNGTVALSADGIPPGAMVTFTSDRIVGSGTSTLLIATSAETPPGTYSIVVHGHGGDDLSDTVQTVSTVLDISGFALELEPQSVTVAQQGTAVFAVRALSRNGYEGRVCVSALSEPVGQMTIIVANPELAVPDGETSIRVETSRATPPGAYTIAVSAGDGIITTTVNASVAVTKDAEIMPGFVLTPGPGYDNRALVRLVNSDFIDLIEFDAFNTRFGANAVMADIDGDGSDEIIVAPGPDPLADGRVKLFTRAGILILEESVLPTKYGATLATGDIDGDGRGEIAAGAGPGLKNTARIRVLSFDGNRLVNTGVDFTAFPSAYKLGVKLALGDVDGDGIPEIIAGAGPSPLNPARVRVFKIDTSSGKGQWRVSPPVSDFVVNFGDWYPYLFGVNVASGDVDGDGMAEIIVGAGPGPFQKAVVTVYKGDGTFSGTRFEAYPADEYRFGVNVVARDLDGDGKAEIITGPGPSPWNDSWVRVFRGDGTILWDGLVVFPEAMKFGVKVTTGNVGQ